MLYTRVSIKLYITKVIYSGMDISFVSSALGTSEGVLYICSQFAYAQRKQKAVHRRAMPLSTSIKFNSLIQGFLLVHNL